MTTPKEIFDKTEWIEKLKKQKKIGDNTIKAFHYVGDIIEDLIEMLCDHEDRIEKLENLLKEHKHLDGKAVREL